MKKLEHLKDITENYELFILDLWGVVHNGVTPYQGALKTIEELYNNNKKYYFLSNAPRPISDVKDFLKRRMKIEEKYLQNIITSGEAAINSIKNFKYGKFFFHLGPERDKNIYEGYEKYKTDLKTCDYILCTGLYDHASENLNFYEKLLEKSLTKKMICTNPDLVVDRGATQEYCAGQIAKIFENLGGKVVYFGKPYKEIYKLIFKKKEKCLIIGDNLRTDIKGANLIKQDSLFIMDGIHKHEIENTQDINLLLNTYGVKTEFIQNKLNW